MPRIEEPGGLQLVGLPRVRHEARGGWDRAGRRGGDSLSQEEGVWGEQLAMAAQGTAKCKLCWKPTDLKHRAPRPPRKQPQAGGLWHTVAASPPTPEPAGISLPSHRPLDLLIQGRQRPPRC